MGSNVETMIVTLKLGTLQNGLLDAAYTPGDEGYEEAARAWNMNAAQRPALVVVAEGVADVMAAVRFARDRGIGLGVMATGHSVGQTSGAYSLFEEIVRPREGIPPRIGHREDGCFYIVEGELEFLAGEKILRAGAGSLVYVPRGSVYAFTNVGETVARILKLLTPGGTHERFYEEIGEEAIDRSTLPIMDVPQNTAIIAEIATRYGIEILPAQER